MLDVIIVSMFGGSFWCFYSAARDFRAWRKGRTK